VHDVSKALTQEQRRFIRDADYLVCCLPIELEVELCLRPTIFPVIERPELSAPHGSFCKRRSSDADVDARRLTHDAALLRNCLGVGDDTARNETLPAFSLANTKIMSPLAISLPPYIVFCAMNLNVFARESTTSALIANATSVLTFGP
jgi:hypothetical protein